MEFLKENEFLIPLIVVALGAIGFLIKHYFFNKKQPSNPAPFISAGHGISAGGDIIVGNKTMIEKENKIETNVHISRFKKDRRSYAEINNIGDEDICDLKITIHWNQEGKEEERHMNRFFNESENPILKSSHECEYLQKGAKKIIAGLPMYSDDGKIVFEVEAKGVKSNDILKKEFIIKNTRYDER